MPRPLMRLFAILLLLGQMVQTSGGVMCARQGGGQAAHCSDGMAKTAGAAVTAPVGGMSHGVCDLMGPCSAPVPAVLTASVVHHFQLIEAQLAAAAAPSRPVSFHSSPTPPPPQA